MQVSGLNVLLVLIGATVAASALMQCDASGGASVFDDAATDASTDDASDSGTLGFGDSAPRDADLPPVEAGDPPLRACVDSADAGDAADATDADAGDAGVCPLPRSVCADIYWLVYYTGGVCVGGVCRWEKQFTRCPDICSNGSCRINTTL